MTQWILVKKVEDGKALIRYGNYEWWIKPGEGIKISTPAINVYDIRTDPDDGTAYQGPIALPNKVEE